MKYDSKLDLLNILLWNGEVLDFRDRNVPTFCTFDVHKLYSFRRLWVITLTQATGKYKIELNVTFFGLNWYGYEFIYRSRAMVYCEACDFFSQF